MTSVVTNAVHADPDDPLLMEDVEATRVDGVGSPATGRGFAMAKGLDEEGRVILPVAKDDELDDSGLSLDAAATDAEETGALQAASAAEDDGGGDVADSMGKAVDYADTKAQSYADPGYQADKKKRYALDNEEQVRAAWSYINQADNEEPYSAPQLKRIRQRIKAAGKPYGIDFAEDAAKDMQTGDTPTDDNTAATAGALAPEKPEEPEEGAELPAAKDDAAPAITPGSTDDASVPGSPAWEATDAAILSAAATKLVEVREMLTAAQQREQIESVTGAEAGEAWTGSTSELLYCALEKLSEVLGKVAAGALLEADDASDAMAKAIGQVQIARSTIVRTRVAKDDGAGGDETDDGNPDIHEAMARLASQCGCEDCTDYLEDNMDAVTDALATAKADEGTSNSDLKEEGTPDGGKAPGAKPADDTNDTASDAGAKTATGDEELSDGSKSDPVAKAVAKAQRKAAKAAAKAAEAAVAKALSGLPTTTTDEDKAEPDQMAKALDTLLERTAALPGLEERLSRVEAQPVPYGPHRYARALEAVGQQISVVPRGPAPDLPADPTALAKALEGADLSPAQRDDIMRRMAVTAHPLASR